MFLLRLRRSHGVYQTRERAEQLVSWGLNAPSMFNQLNFKDMKQKVFFAESGLTSTSANHVANLAKEFVQDEEMQMNNIRFVNCYVSVIGSSEKTQICKGIEDSWLQFFTDNVVSVYEAKSLIAWLREAIKAKEEMLKDVDNMEIEEWAAQNDIVMPVRPTRRSVLTREMLIASLDVKERNRIYKLETEAAVIGKCIHPDGKFSDSRKEMHERLSNPIDIKGEGREALVYSYELSCDYNAVDNTFFTLQQWHREAQAELNSILYKIDEQVRNDEISADTEYVEARKAYEREYETIRTQYIIWKKQESARISSLKIVIPNDLTKIYERVNKLG